MNFIFIDYSIFVTSCFLIFVYCLLINLSKINFFINYIIVIVIFSCYLLINSSSKITLTNNIDNIINFSLRNYLINFVQSKYNLTTSSFINMLIFSHKNDIANDIYKLFSNISIVHLIVISGFHINLFVFLISKIFLKFKKISKFVSIFFVFIMCYLNNFSLSIFRAFIYLLLSFFGRIKKDNYIWLSIIIISLIAPGALKNYGLQMSYICLVAINLLKNLKMKSKVTKGLIISMMIMIFLIPYNSILNGRISLFGPIWSLLFSLIISFVYFFLSIFFIFDFLIPTIEYLIFLLIDFSKIINNININFLLPQVDEIIWFFYLLIAFIFSKFLLHKRG